MNLADLVYRHSENFPQRETFGLRQQLERSAVSVPSNIAEGHARDSTREYLHHLAIALGSIVELETQIILARKREYLGEEAAAEVLALSDELGKMLRGLQKSLKMRL